MSHISRRLIRIICALVVVALVVSALGILAAIPSAQAQRQDRPGEAAQVASSEPTTPLPPLPPQRSDLEQSVPHLANAELPATASRSVQALTLYPWSRLAFQSIRDNNWEIYTGNDDGSGQTRLTYANASDMQARFNREATRIVFASNRTGNYEIFSMNADGSGLTQLTSNSSDDVMPYWSPDGSRIVFQAYRNGQPDIYVMNADGTGQTRLTTNSDYDGQPAWSPDGTQIAFVSKRTGGQTDYWLWVMNANGSNQHLLANQPYSEHPVWSPTGAQIAYDAAGADLWQNLWLVNADGSSPRSIFDEGGYADAWAGSWSPDGRYVAFTRIYYQYYAGQWYWTNAYLDAWDSMTTGVTRLSYSGTDWRPDWQSTDISAPVSSISPLVSPSPSPITVQWSGSDAGPSGLKNYDVQVKEGAGAWTDWKIATTATSATYPGLGGHTYYFRVRARDNAGNVEAWPATYDASATVESLPPVSAVSALPAFTKNNVMIHWSGQDYGGSGIQNYDVQYRDGASGIWTNWQTGTIATSASFSGVTGHSYYFRSRARDLAQNLEGWPTGDGDTSTLFYAWAISGTVRDNTGSPLVDASIATVPTAYAVFATDPGGLYAAYVVTTSSTYTASWSKSGYGSLPETAFTSASLSPVAQGTLPAQSNGGPAIVTVSGLTPGTAYRIIVRGLWTYAGAYGAIADAQWTSYSCAPNVLCYYARQVLFNGVPLAAQNGQDVVDPNHEYTYLWTADGSQLQMYIVDSTYSDNSGALTFEMFAADADVGLDVFLPPADNVIQNGDFESGALNSPGWTIGGEITPVLTSTVRHTGQQSVLLGTTSVSQTGDSAISQVVTIPLTMSFPVLSFLYLPDKPYLNNELISYWKLDETTGDAIDAVGTNTLTAINAPGSITGVVRTARTFSGDHQYFSIPTNSSVEIGDTSFTFTAWAKMNNKTDYHVFIGKQVEDSPYYDRDYSLCYDKDVDRFYFQAAGPDGLTLTRAIANSIGSPMIDTWYFLAGGYDYANGYLWISVNGGPKETVPFTGSVHVGSAPFMLGAVDNPQFGYQAGLLDEVGFWKRVLTSEEIAALYNDGQGSTYPFATNGAFDIQVDDGITATTVFSSNLKATDWTHQWLDLSTWKGQTVTLTFTTRQEAGNPLVGVYLDEVSLGSAYPNVWTQVSGPASAPPGAQIQYRLHYGNQGGALADAVVLTATLPAELTLLQASLPPLTTTPSLVWNVGDLAAQSGPDTIVLTATIAPTATPFSPLISHFTIDPGNPELEKANNSIQFQTFVEYQTLLPVIRH